MEENHSALSCALVIKRLRNGRCQYDPRAKRELVEAGLQPGVSVAMHMRVDVKQRYFTGLLSVVDRRCIYFEMT